MGRYAVHDGGKLFGVIWKVSTYGRAFIFTVKGFMVHSSLFVVPQLVFMSSAL